MLAQAFWVATLCGQITFSDDFEASVLSPQWVQFPGNTPDAGFGLVDGAGRPTAERGLRFFDFHRAIGSNNIAWLSYAGDGGTSRYFRSFVRVNGDGGQAAVMQINAFGTP